jgi:2-oxoglutarate dehydrogenase E1 component
MLEEVLLHRHAVLRDEVTNKAYNRLSNLPDSKAKFRIYNSLLSEYGVLGFEYGYAMANPNALVYGKHSLAILEMVHKS